MRLDPYLSRTEFGSRMLPRIDPVIYGPGVPKNGGPSMQELDKFRRDGYLPLPGFFRPDQIDAVRASLQKLSQDSGCPQGPEWILEPDSTVVRSVFDIHYLDSASAELSQDPRLLSYVEAILDSDTYIHQSRVNFKPALDGREFYWHSDFETWHMEDGMSRMRAVTAVIALTENNGYNGPLLVIPKSHGIYVQCQGQTPKDHYKKSLRKQEYGVPDQDSLRVLVDAGGMDHFEGPPGSVFLFDCNTMHGSGGNLSPWARSNLFFVYNSVENSLEEPCGGGTPRPEYVAHREQTPPVGTQRVQ